jgi:hypothetical protein
MRANVGDELIVEETEICGAARVGTIVAVKGSDGSPPYLVHWVAGDYDSLVSPWPGVRVRHKAGDGTPPAITPAATAASTTTAGSAVSPGIRRRLAATAR